MISTYKIRKFLLKSIQSIALKYVKEPMKCGKWLVCFNNEKYYNIFLTKWNHSDDRETNNKNEFISCVINRIKSFPCGSSKTDIFHIETLDDKVLLGIETIQEWILVFI